jgi:hypothetical protein
MTDRTDRKSRMMKEAFELRRLYDLLDQWSMFNTESYSSYYKYDLFSRNLYMGLIFKTPKLHGDSLGFLTINLQ